MWARASPASVQAWLRCCSQPELPWWPRDAASIPNAGSVSRGGAWCSPRQSCAAYPQPTSPSQGCCHCLLHCLDLYSSSYAPTLTAGKCPGREAVPRDTSSSLHHHPQTWRTRRHGTGMLWHGTAAKSTLLTGLALAGRKRRQGRE